MYLSIFNSYLLGSSLDMFLDPALDLSCLSTAIQRRLSFGKDEIISFGNPSITPAVNQPIRRQIAISATLILLEAAQVKFSERQFSSIANFL